MTNSNIIDLPGGGFVLADRVIAVNAPGPGAATLRPAVVILTDGGRMSVDCEDAEMAADLAANLRQAVAALYAPLGGTGHISATTHYVLDEASGVAYPMPPERAP